MWRFLAELAETYDVDHAVGLVDDTDDLKTTSRRENPNMCVGTLRPRILLNVYSRIHKAENSRFYL